MNQIAIVNFHGTELLAYHMGGVVFVALKPIVEGMGLDWSAQYRRVMRTPILAEGIAKMATPLSHPAGGQEMVCLRMNLVHGWLLTINSSQVRPELRERVEVYQRECYDVLHRHFSGERDKLIREENETLSLNLRLCTEARHIHGNLAAAQLWNKLGLPRVPAMDDTIDLFNWREYRKAA
jgi:hypothetical protein